MLKYLIIILDDTAPSFCHYVHTAQERRLMPLEILKKGIAMARDEGFGIQVLLPDDGLSTEYQEIIDSVDNVLMARIGTSADADVEILDGLPTAGCQWKPDGVYIVQLDASMLTNAAAKQLAAVAMSVGRLNLLLTDIDTLTDADFQRYQQFLETMAETIAEIAVSRPERSFQLNVLTDRIRLETMNNCGAGDESIALAPNGKFYVCPAFYYGHDSDVGDVDAGIQIKNAQLYRLAYAPICQRCEAYHCHRCIWLNKRTTLEVNTPSHEQCVASHLERNASMLLQQKLRSHHFVIDGPEIPPIDYVDPFEKANKWTRFGE